MGIVTPAWQFSNSSSNVTGTIPAVDFGTTVTPGTSNADGSSVSILSALGHDGHFLIVSFAGFLTTLSDCSSLADILIDPAGGTSWSSFIDDLVCGSSLNQSAGNKTHTFLYCFPIFIKSGSSIGCRARTAAPSGPALPKVGIWVLGNPTRPDMWWCGQKVEGLGIDAANSKGTNLTPGNSGSFSSWTTIGTSGHPYGAVQLGVQSHLTSLTNTLGYHWQIGHGSTQLPGSPTWFMNSGADPMLRRIGFNLPVWCDVPASTTWQARATCSGTAQAMNVAIYGVY